MRYVHTGKVCSGDYLNEDEPTDGYLMDQGFMIELIVYLWIMLMCLGCCIFCVSIFLATS